MSRVSKWMSLAECERPSYVYWGTDMIMILIAGTKSIFSEHTSCLSHKTRSKTSETCEQVDCRCVWRKAMHSNREKQFSDLCNCGREVFMSRTCSMCASRHECIAKLGRYGTRSPASDGCHAKHSDLDVECIFCLAGHFCNVLWVNGNKCNYKKEKHLYRPASSACAIMYHL